MTWRHIFVRCADNCGFKGQRTADSAVEATKNPCPRCGGPVASVASEEAK